MLFYRLERSERQIPLGMGERDPSRFCRVLQLDVAALLGDLEPTVGLQKREDYARVHECVVQHTRAQVNRKVCCVTHKKSWTGELAGAMVWA